MESFSDNLLLRIFTIAVVELGQPRLAVVVEDEDGFDHGGAAAAGLAGLAAPLLPLLLLLLPARHAPLSGRRQPVALHDVAGLR